MASVRFPFPIGHIHKHTNTICWCRDKCTCSLFPVQITDPCNSWEGHQVKCLNEAMTCIGYLRCGQCFVLTVVSVFSRSSATFNSLRCISCFSNFIAYKITFWSIQFLEEICTLDAGDGKIHRIRLSWPAFWKGIGCTCRKQKHRYYHYFNLKQKIVWFSSFSLINSKNKTRSARPQ